ncbi:cytochrome c oxidase subunit III [gamma proteobacterium HdN1]|nr:cytochrome c oxidase subunit III [gamma proteobacterium HdN1]
MGDAELVDAELDDSHGSQFRLAGDLAVWLVILIELVTFGLFFMVFAFKRAFQVDLFNRMQSTLDLHSGVVNTILLITSSWFVARCVAAVRKGQSQAGARWLALAIVCGAAFLVMKTVEFKAKFDLGVNLSTNDFYMLYFTLAGFHMLHVVVGVIILAMLLVMVRRGKVAANNMHALETGAAFWHMVDLLWIILFPLVYVMR